MSSTAPGLGVERAARHHELRSRLPWLTILGGCGGTDVRHVPRWSGVKPAAG